MSVLSSTPEEAVLLACLQAYFRTRAASEVDSLLTVDLDWDLLIKIATTKGVMPLLHQILQEICMLESCPNAVRCIPQSVMIQLKILSQMNGRNNLAKAQELVRILTLLESAGIEAIAFKGAVLATSVYGDLGLRQFNDLDILIRRRDFGRTIAILNGLGYQSGLSPEIESYLFANEIETPLYYRNSEANIVSQQVKFDWLDRHPELSIDLHWSIPPRRILDPDRCDRLWANLSSIELLDRQIKIFAPEATLVIQSINVAKECQNISIPEPIEQICDVAKVIQVDPNLDWQLALAIARELQAQKLFLIGLFMTQDLLKITLPEVVQSQLVGVASPLENRQLGHNFAISRNHQTLWHLLVDPLMTMDWSLSSIVTIGLHLNRSISPNQNDLKFLILPRRLFFLYYLIRPIRLLAKYLDSPFR